MQLAGAGVRRLSEPYAGPGEHRFQLGHVFGQVVYVDRAVLDQVDRLEIARCRALNAAQRTAQRPDLVAILAEPQRPGIAHAEMLHLLHHRDGSGFDFLA